MLQDIADDAQLVRESAELLEKLTREQYFPKTRDEVLEHIKAMKTLLVSMTRYILIMEDERGRMVQTSDTMPCLACNDYYPLASEMVRGIRWEPVPGKNEWVYMCWECTLALDKLVHQQLSGLTYTFLFSLDKHTKALAEETLPPVKDIK